MPHKLERSVTAGAVKKGAQGVSAVLNGLYDIFSVFPYLFNKCIGLVISALQWAGRNVAQAIGVLVMTLLALVYLDGVYQIRIRVSCFLSPALCVSGYHTGQDMRVR